MRQGSLFFQQKHHKLLRQQRTATIRLSSSSSLIISHATNALRQQDHYFQLHNNNQGGFQQEQYLAQQQRFYCDVPLSSVRLLSMLQQQQQQQQQQQHKAMFHSSRRNQEGEKKEGEPAKKEGDKEEDDDECPEWQNPLHHNNPEMNKIFPEDFGPGETMVPQELPPFQDPNNPDAVIAPKHIHELADEIVHLSMLEMNELINKIADHFGFDKPPFEAGAKAGGAADEDEDDEEGGAKAEEEKTVFDIKLVSFDAKSKIKVIKEVRALAGLGLKEAKEVVESAPKVIQKDIKKEDAEEIKKKLEEIGAAVEIV